MQRANNNSSVNRPRRNYNTTIMTWSYDYLTSKGNVSSKTHTLSEAQQIRRQREKETINAKLI